MLLKFLKGKLKPEGAVELNYHNDEPAPAVATSAFVDAGDPGPAAHAVVPPVVEKAYVDPIAATPEPSIFDAAPPVAEVVKPIEPPVVRNEIIVKLPNAVRPRQVSPPTPPPRELGEYHLPSWECLSEAEHGYVESQEAFVREKAAVLEQALKEFNVDAHVVEIDTEAGHYYVRAEPGTRVESFDDYLADQ